MVVRATGILAHSYGGSACDLAEHACSECGKVFFVYQSERASPPTNCPFEKEHK